MIWALTKLILQLTAAVCFAALIVSIVYHIIMIGGVLIITHLL